MEYLVFLLFLVTCIVGIAAFVVSITIYLKYRRKTILLYAGYLGSLGCAVGSYSAKIVDSVAVVRNQSALDSLVMLAYLFEFASLLTYTVVTLFFVHHLMGISVSPFKRNIFLAIPLITIISYFYWLISSNEMILHGMVLPWVYGISIYGLYIIFSKLSTIGDKTLKRAIKTFLIVSGVFLPIYILSSIAELSPQLPIKNLYLIVIMIYFLVINSLGIVFAVKFFNQPSYMSENIITDYFTEKFNISSRESDIVGLVIVGLSNKEIGEKLFISFKTVENHLYKIFQKTGVRNRVELTNLIQTNKNE